MIFSEFLKEKRLKENLSQKELVCALMLFDETFKTLTIVSLGRWERGVTEPTMKKMLLISKFFNIKWNVFFPRIKVKLSKTKIHHFNSWIQHFIQLGLIHNYMGYTSSKPERYIKEIFDYNNPLYLKLSKENIDKIINYENKVMGLNHENRINHSSFVKWCDSGNLFNILYYTENNNIEAHCTISLHAASSEKELVNNYKNNLNLVNTVPIKNKDNPLILFIHTSIVHDDEWLNFIVKSLTSMLLDNWNIQNIIFGDYDSEASYRHESAFNAINLGFKINPNYKTSVKERIVKISTLDFLSQHGIVERFQTKTLS